MIEEKKALSCPFCGGRSHHILGARQIRMPDVVNCLDCFAEIQGTYEPESALIKWNTRAQLPSKGGEAVAWREHSVNYAKGEKCPETIETLQAAWDRDQELINDMRHEIARHKTRINRLEQRRPADQVAEGVVVSQELLERAIQVLRQPDGGKNHAQRVDKRKAQEELRAILEQKP